MIKHIFTRIVMFLIVIFCICTVLVIPASAEPYWTESNYLDTHERDIHELVAETGTKLEIHAPAGSNFNLYGKKKTFSGPCSMNISNLVNYADTSTIDTETDTIILDPGVWCLVVIAESGAGNYVLEASELSIEAIPFGSDDMEEDDHSGMGSHFNGTWGSEGIDWEDYNEETPPSGWGAVPGSASSSGSYWTKSYFLSTGLGAMHEIQVVNGAELVLHSPPGANFDLYAMNNPGAFGTCPSNSYIMSHADRSTAGMGDDVLVLEPGLWCLVVYAQSGSGTYLLEASSLSSGSSGGWPGDSGSGSEGGWEGSSWIPDSPGIDEGMYNPFGPSGSESPWGEDEGGSEGHFGNYSGDFESTCSPYRSVTNSGMIKASEESPGGSGYLQADTYSFQVQGYRSDIELIIVGPCGLYEVLPGEGDRGGFTYAEMELPDRILTDSEVDNVDRIMNASGCGAPYTMTVTLNCDPQYQYCDPAHEQHSVSNAYYRIRNPSPGSIYYVSIAGDEENTIERAYTLLVRSYQC